MLQSKRRFGIGFSRLILIGLVIVSCVPSHANAATVDDSISFKSQDNVSSAPVSLLAGSGYYSNHPIYYNSGIGSNTQVADLYSSTSMRRDIGFARKVDGETEFFASDSSSSCYGPGYSAVSGTSKAHMRIDENVTDGRVQIGVHAWKNPSLEIDEEYVGTYHIYKNMTLLSSYTLDAEIFSCCTGCYFGLNGPYQSSQVQADNIFNYKAPLN